MYLPSPALLAVPRNVFTAIGLPVVGGLLSGSYTGEIVKGQWYANLRFPPGRPPNRVFPFVWTTLYIAMGYASHLAVQAHENALLPSDIEATSTAIWLYYAQLAFNFLWTPLFFVRKQTTLALIDSSLLTASTIWMTKLLHGPTGGKTTWFLAPYCVWLSFATYLNAGVVVLNRGRKLSKED